MGAPRGGAPIQLVALDRHLAGPAADLDVVFALATAVVEGLEANRTANRPRILSVELELARASTNVDAGRDRPRPLEREVAHAAGDVDRHHAGGCGRRSSALLTPPRTSIASTCRRRRSASQCATPHGSR